MLMLWNVNCSWFLALQLQLGMLLSISKFLQTRTTAVYYLLATKCYLSTEKMAMPPFLTCWWTGCHHGGGLLLTQVGIISLHCVRLVYSPVSSSWEPTSLCRYTTRWSGMTSAANYT